MASFSDKTPPPFDKNVDNYTKWKKKFKIWQSITDVADTKQGGLLVLRLDELTQETVMEAVTETDIRSATGAAKVLTQMDIMFKQDDAVTGYEAYEAFETYQRPQSMSIKDYCTEFERRLKKVADNGTTLADCVTAYRLLKSANLSEAQQQLLKATCKMTYKDLSTQMKKIFVTDMQGSSEVQVKEEPIEPVEYVEQETLFGRSRYNNSDKWRKNNYYKGSTEQGKSWHDQKGRGGNNQEGADNRDWKVRKKRGKNPPDQYGRVSRCLNCDSINHWIKDCPDLTDKEQKAFLENYQEGNQTDGVKEEPDL